MENNGIESEKFVANKLSRFGEIEMKHTWGIDLLFYQREKVVSIEVKSAHYFIKDKCSKKGCRKGNFYFYRDNLERPDFFAFVIIYSDDSKVTLWVRGDDLRERVKCSNATTKICLSIPSLMRDVPKVDFSEVLGV